MSSTPLPFRITLARCLALSVFVLAVCVRPADALTLYVAPDGNDAASGKSEKPQPGKPDGPLATLAGARDALRRIRKAGGSNEPVHIVVADGLYELREPLLLEPQDGGTAEAPVSYEAAPGAHPLLSGGRKITGFKPTEGGLWKAELPEVRDGKWYFEQLWVNGARATRARTPNDGYFHAAGAANAPVPNTPLASTLEKTAIGMKPADLASLAGLSPAELNDVNAIVYHSWNTSRHRVAGVDQASGTLQFTGPARWAFFQSEPYHRVVLENYRAALDAPGEWFLDRKGELLYLPRPGEKPETAEVIAPTMEKWLVLKGDAAGKPIEHIRFVGLHFAYSLFLLAQEGWSDAQADAALGAGISINDGNHIAFDQCEIDHTGGYAIWFEHGCHHGSVDHCYLHELGAGGVKVGETRAPKDEAGQTGHIVMRNNIIRDGGYYFPGSIGIWIAHSGDNEVLHNEISGFYYTAISVGWVWGFHPSLAVRNRIEYNHLHHLGWKVLSDFGGVYTLGPSAGTVIRNNRIHDCACYSYGGWGIYPDEGSSDMLIEDNLVYRTQSAGFHQHYGEKNLVTNNIFAYGTEMQLRHSRKEDHLAFTFEHNIVLWKEGKLLGHIDANWLGDQVKLDHNLYWPEDGQPFVFAGKTLEEWTASGQDQHSLIADPLFVAPTKDDFHLRPGSPAEGIGFHPFDYEKAGVEGDPAWVQLAAGRVYPPMDFSELKFEAPPLNFREGFEYTPLGSSKLRMAHPQTGGRDNAIQVVAESPSEGQRCLRLTDGPDLKPAFNPHLYYSPHHRTGTTRFKFDVKLDAQYRLVHEWRNNATPYRTGPMLVIEKGALTVNGKKLMEVPPMQWAHLEIEAALGDKAPGVWNLTVTLPGAAPQRFEGLKFVHPEARTLDWLGFSSPGTVAASCWLDALELKNH